MAILLATPAWAMDPHQGFGTYKWGLSCQSFVKGPSWATERAKPIWDPKVQMFALEYVPEGEAKGRFTLRYNKDENPNFEGVPLARAFYGCDNTTGRFSLMVLSHDLLAVPELIRKATALLGPPTQTTMIQTIWSLPDLYVQIDQVYMIIYDKRAGKI
jgi:hypothetical protein